MHAHNGKPNLRGKKEGVTRIERPAMEIVSLEMTTKSVGAGTHWKSWREGEFQILGAATLKLPAPNEV